MTKTKLDLELILPTDAAACDACVERLLTSMRGATGVTEVHVDQEQPGKPRLCLHYDAQNIRLEDLTAHVQRSGAALKSHFGHLAVPVRGLRHERQAKVAEQALAREPGVLEARVAFGTRRVFVEFDPEKTSREALLAALGRAGLEAGVPPVAAAADHVHREGDDHAHDHTHGGPFGERSELVFSLACGALAGAGWGLGKAGIPTWIPTAVFVAAYLLGSWFTVQEVLVALRARKFEIDFLMLLAAVGAALLGEWFEGALLLFLFTLGHSLESFAMGRARKAIEALSQLVPQKALRVDAAGVQTEVSVSELVVGDRVLVKPNMRIPSDGFVVEGQSSVNQAPITGESVPVDKRPVPDPAAAAASPGSVAAEHRVFAGTINGPSALTTRVTKAEADSTLARVVKMVSEAETQKSATQQFTDRFERVFVPVIVGVVGLLMLAFLVIDETFARSFYRAMAVLVAASPCALAIATPSAVLAGVARAARGGVLVKGGANLETLGMVQAVAFDKTGTLTEGKPKLTDVVVVPGASETELLQVALAVELQSDHPLASAIVTGARARLAADGKPIEAQEVEAIMGFGVRAVVGGAPVLIGKAALFTREAPLPPEVASLADALLTEGRSLMIVKAGARFLGVLGMMDVPRASAKEVVAELRRLGIGQTVMLTGDNQQVADSVAKQLGITVARGDLLPEQKVEAIAQLALSASRVAMVGDGVNDAPALARASVGITMGAGGSEIALETADVALMADDLRALPFAIGLSRAARRIIRQNLWASLGMVAFLVPATIFGVAGIGAAVALHEGSTLLVVINALRLLAYRDPRS